MLSNLFEKHGQFCAKHPWEVIVAVLTLTACMLSMDNSSHSSRGHPASSFRAEETNAVDIIFMTIIRCSAILYSYYQFRKLRKLGSKYILGIAGLFTVFSSFVFSSTVINFLKTDVSDLKDALFFFVLVIDLSKASVLAQFALDSSSQKEVNYNIARGMSLLGPTVTLDTLVGTLVISVGTLSGVKRLETLCCFACFSFVVNYLVFMTFYPACLSLVLELSRSGSCGPNERGTYFERTSSLVELLYDEGHKPNPVVQRVKVIMSAGMMIVHAHSRWSLNNMENNDSRQLFTVMSGMAAHSMPRNGTQADDLQSYILRFLAMVTDHIVILILLLALSVKYYFFDDADNLVDYPFQNQMPSSMRQLLRSEHKIIQTDVSFAKLMNSACQTSPILSADAKSQQNDGESVETQTEIVDPLDCESSDENKSPTRSTEECFALYKKQGSAELLSNREICNLVVEKRIMPRELDRIVSDPVRGVAVRRQLYSENGGFQNVLKSVPYLHYNYKQVIGKCCENVVGYIPVPLGIAGPLIINGKEYYLPMATTEGCLVASTSRGCKILNESGGVSCVVEDIGMTRAPAVDFPSLQEVRAAEEWIKDKVNFEKIKNCFDSTSAYARLQEIKCITAGNKTFLRFRALTGDAMGMNMVSKGAEEALKFIQLNVKGMNIVSLSGNACTDKKPSAMNWIEGRGKNIRVDATIPRHIVETQLRTTSKDLETLFIHKNLIGSCMAGSIGGFNAHAANIVTAMFIATGQDPAQNVSSSNCMTIMECKDNNDLYISCTMPSLEVGTVGGGTALSAQAACLDILGVRGPNVLEPGENAKTLAQIIGGAVLAGELSLMAALCTGELVKSHLTHNRTALAEKPSLSLKRVLPVSIATECAPS